MRKPFKKELANIPLEGAHGTSGQRHLVLSEKDDISSQLKAMANTYLQSGSKFDWHMHDKVDEFFVVLGGTGKISFKDGSAFEYKAKDVVYIPANLEHMIEATGETESEFFFIRVNE